MTTNISRRNTVVITSVVAFTLIYVCVQVLPQGAQLIHRSFFDGNDIVIHGNSVDSSGRGLAKSVYDPLSLTFSSVELQKVSDVLFDEQEAYFMSVLVLNNTLWASYRTSLSTWETIVVQLNREFRPLPQTKVVISEVEDARVFEFDGKGWLVDNHFMYERFIVSIDGKHRIRLDESQLGDFSRGKNWSPFVYSSRLYFVYSLRPLRILGCDMDTGRLAWAYGGKNEGKSEDPDTSWTRGGTNAVLHGGFVYGIGRQTKHETIVCDGAIFPNIAQHYPLLWRFPISTLQNGEPSIEHAQIRQVRHPFVKGVNDPASLFVYDSTLYVTVSSCSCVCYPEFSFGNVMNNTIFRVALATDDKDWLS